MAEARLGEPDRYTCSICLDMLKDPVTIPCGHSYCMRCIDKCWKTEDHRRAYSCPQCRHVFKSKPSLNRSTVLAEIMERVRDTTPQVSESAESLAGPGDIACDFCQERKLKAVKSCLVCQCFYCENHLHPHYNVPALKKHKLVNPTLMATCSKHDKLLEFYCRTDQTCVCTHCLLDDHKGHNMVPSADERNEKQIKLMANLAGINEILLSKEMQKIFDTTNLSHSSKKAVEDSRKVFTEISSLFEKKSTELIEKIECHEKADLDQCAKHQEKLMEEITELKKSCGVIEKLLQTEDNIYFLQNFDSVPSSSASNDLPSLFYENSYTDVSKLVTELKERLETVCNEEINKTLKKVSDLFTKNNPVSLIKIGDKVRLKPSVHTPRLGWGSITQKSVGVVQNVQGQTVKVDFLEQKGWRGDVSEMELNAGCGGVTHNSIGVIKKAHSLSVGAKVRVNSSISNPAFGWGNITKDCIGVVKAIDGTKVTVTFPRQSNWKGIISEMEAL